MSVLELAERFSKEAKSGFVLDWRKKRDEIVDEYPQRKDGHYGPIVVDSCR
jgi:hypothetical protein